MTSRNPVRPPVPPRRKPPEKQRIQHGGYDHQFVQRVTENLKCQVCTKPLCDPHLTTCCGQHFCKVCLESYSLVQGKEKCPHCRAEGKNFQHVLDKKLRRELESLRIFCPHRGKGCTWMGEIGSLKAHLESDSGCGFVEIECPNKCSVGKVQRHAIDNHLKTECERRPSQCFYCGHTDIFGAFKGKNNHYESCPEYQLECPNKCGVKNLKRKELESHLKICRPEHGLCPFEEVGCEMQFKQHELKQHLATQLQHHLLLVMEAYREVKTELQDTTQMLQQHIIRDAEMKQAVVMDLKLVRASLATNKEQTNFALAAIQTQVGEVGFNWLKKRDDRIAFRMLNFNQHKVIGREWHTPPFYYKEGYKMCLAVQPNKTNSLSSPRRSSKQCQVTLSLFLVKGEYDSDLNWPIQSNFELKVSVLEQQTPVGATVHSNEPVRVNFCSRCKDLGHFKCLGRNEERREVENLGNFKITEDVEVMGDSIVLAIKVSMHKHSTE